MRTRSFRHTRNWLRGPQWSAVVGLQLRNVRNSEERGTARNWGTGDWGGLEYRLPRVTDITCILPLTTWLIQHVESSADIKHYIYIYSELQNCPVCFFVVLLSSTRQMVYFLMDYASYCVISKSLYLYEQANRFRRNCAFTMTDILLS